MSYIGCFVVVVYIYIYKGKKYRDITQSNKRNNKNSKDKRQDNYMK